MQFLGKKGEFTSILRGMGAVAKEDRPKIGKIVTERAQKWQERFPVLGDVRGLGAMIGLEFVKDPATREPDGELVTALVQECARHGLIIENAGRYGQVIRFLAPLVITDEQLNCGLDILEKAIETCLK